MSDPSDALVLAESKGQWAKLTLNKPDVLNALSPAIISELMEWLDKLETDPNCRAILLTSAGRAFCAGQNLRERDPRKLDGPLDLSRTVGEGYNPLIRRIRGYDKPIVAAVQGVAAGAGVGLALSCDITLAADDACFALSFARLGLVPDSGTSWALVRRLGEARAMDLVLRSARLSGTAAAEAGLVARSVPANRLLEEAEALVTELAAGPELGLKLCRRAIRDAATTTFDEQLVLEARLQGEAGLHPDYGEGVLSFLEKRSPNFSGVRQP